VTGLLYLEHIRTQTDAFIAAMDGDLDRRVSPCSDWNVGDLADDGSSSDLFYALWRRVPLDDFEIEGDRAAAERLFAWSDLT
jgi:hypothetical protein